MELQNYSSNLPDTIEDLSKFVLIGREKLSAVRAEIRAIEKVGLAKEVYDQKLAEAQEIAEIVLDAETQMGRLLQEVPDESGTRTDKPQVSGEPRYTLKQKAYEQVGGENKAKRYQTLAKHPEEVERAKTEARERGTVVRRQDVFSNIKPERPAPSKKKRIEEIKQKRKEFEERKNDDVISLNDVKADKGNAKIIALQFYQDTLKAINTVNELMFDYSKEEISEYASLLEDDKVEDIEKQLGYARGILMSISHAMEGRK